MNGFHSLQSAGQNIVQCLTDLGPEHGDLVLDVTTWVDLE